MFAEGIEGKVAVDPDYAEGLSDLDGFSHIYLFYHFYRPDKLGMSLVRLDRMEDNTLYVKDIDILDGTPVLDIKSCIQRFDYRKSVICEWQDNVSDRSAFTEVLRNYGKRER